MPLWCLPLPSRHSEYQLILDWNPEYVLIKRFKKKPSLLQYFPSIELSMETFPVGAGGVLILFVNKMIKLVILAN